MNQSVIALFLLLISGSVFAASGGPYVVLNVGQSSTDTLHLSDKTATGVSGIAGYQFNDYLGLEVHYTDFGSVTFQSGGRSDIVGYGLSVVGTYPFDQEWSVFAKFGATHTIIRANSAFGDVTRCNGSWGFGGQYNFTPAWGIRLSYDRYGVGAKYNLDSAHTSLTSVGVQYRF